MDRYGNVRLVRGAPCFEPPMDSSCAAGRYTPLRIVQTALAGLIFLCMVGSMISGIVLSRHVFAFLPKHGGYELAQQVHILCAYWGFICMSLHLGFHWSMMLAMARKHLAALIHANMEPAADRLVLGSVWHVRFPT